MLTRQWIYSSLLNLEELCKHKAYITPVIDETNANFYKYHSLFNWALSRENLSSGFPTKWDSNQSPQLKRLARKNELSFVASWGMVLSKRRITKALIRLRGCAGWSAPLLFAILWRQVFSRGGNYGIVCQNWPETYEYSMTFNQSSWIFVKSVL